MVGYCIVRNGQDVTGVTIWGCYSRRKVRVLSWVDMGPRVIVGDLFDSA